jgi:hypothetical protein
MGDAKYSEESKARLISPLCRNVQFGLAQSWLRCPRRTRLHSRPDHQVLRAPCLRKSPKSEGRIEESYNPETKRAKQSFCHFLART